MKKTVEVNGQKQKVEFESYLLNKEVVFEDKKTGAFEVRGQEGFKINGVEYKVDFVSRRGKKKFSKASQSYTYKGVPFPDSQKKIIEFILENEL